MSESQFEPSLTQRPGHNFLARVLVSLFLTLVVTQSATAQSPGVIEGQVLNGTSGADPQGLVDLPVTLVVAAEAGTQTTLSTTGDEEGRFRFEGLDTQESTLYQVQVEYRGAIYTSEAQSFPSGGNLLPFFVTVYEAAESDEGLGVSRHHILVEFQEGSLAVVEFMIVENTGDRTYIGGENRQTVLLPLPAGATSIQFDDPSMEQNVVFTSSGLALTQPLLPGTTPFLFSYLLPNTQSEYLFTKPLAYPTANINFLVEDVGAQAESSTLAFAEMVEAEGRKYLHYFAHNLEAGTVVSVRLSQIPLSVSTPETVPGNPILPAEALLGLTAVAMVGILAWALRRKPATAALSSREALIRAIADLDDAYAAGQVPKEEWRRRRAVMKEELARVWQRGKEES